MPTIGSHCLGTNHQDIAGIERVVFLGDSVTVGTPPTLPGDIYRSKLADALAGEFMLQFGEGGNSELLWQLVDLFNGVSIARDSGAFSSCAKWGARTDDLLAPGPQIADCFPEETRGLRTLVVMTMGGNDISSLTQDAIDGVPMEMLWASIMDAVQLNREAVQWLKDPTNFPNGSFVVFGNLYEFTDGTGDVMACDVSGLAGFDQPIPAPDELAEMVIWANEQYMEIAVETGSDMIFMLEAFCGHGFNADDPTAPCYRGPGTETWFDLTCIHPNPTGHQQLSDMFLAVVDE
ncbi:MAG TPA: SGNH/GDSL hydrolase family protein [Nannocystaceae bacterium]|nr:SGNH/GDSL hydrolase family protein [Nannocystaceae bacterium]